LADTNGFTGRDLKLLQEALQRGTDERGWANQGWHCGQIIANEFSQYLAMWDNASTGRGTPALVIVRFGKTGTYALLVNDRIVANGSALDDILPALAAAVLKTGET